MGDSSVASRVVKVARHAVALGVLWVGGCNTLAGLEEFSPAAPSPEALCGNGLREKDEACDGADLGAQSCESAVGTGSVGSLSCATDCRLITAGCVGPPRCGDGVKSGDEACDGEQIGEATCAGMLGVEATGVPGCAADCASLLVSSCRVKQRSCEGLDGACGGADDCCTKDPVPGGVFLMGRGVDGPDAYGVMTDDEQPEHEVEVAPFLLDRYEATVGRFRRFVDEYDAFLASGRLFDGAGAHPAIEGSGWRSSWISEGLLVSAAELRSALRCEESKITWTDEPGDADNRPINCVNWYEALAFCIWDGGRLPTEAEWEFAAAGGSENRRFPWGPQAPDKTLAVYGCEFAQPGCVIEDLPPVGSTPAGKGLFEHRDLAGSLEEWCFDWHDDAWYAQVSASGLCVNCAKVTRDTSFTRSQRGGHFIYQPRTLRAAYRGHRAPLVRAVESGFRCAWDP